jgi:toxin ParE1/3/4
MKIRVLEPATLRIAEIYLYTRDRWGAEQAERYEDGLFQAIESLAIRTSTSRRAPPSLGFDGYVLRYGRHYIYWRYLEGGDIGIVSVLHESMHQKARLRGDLQP